MRKFWKIPVLGGLVLLLVLVRVFEEDMFYDSFMHFYRGLSPEEGLAWQLHLKVALRYLINTLISLFILYVVFQKAAVVRFSGLLFVLLFVILFPLYLYFMKDVRPDAYLAAFYVRRFLIQPLMLLLLLPAFYYQQLNEKPIFKE